MDVVLEIFDQYVGDRLWAYMLPAFPGAQSALSPSKSDLLLPNGTYSSMRQAATGVSSAYTYHPASQYMNLEPSDFAYMSQWNRNNVWRQAASLFAITLYVLNLLLRSSCSKRHSRLTSISFLTTDYSATQCTS